METSKSITQSKFFVDGMLLMVAIIWGVGFPLTNMAMETGMPPNLFIATRFCLASLIMAIIFKKELAFATLRDVEYGVVAGTLLFLTFVAQTYGIKYTSTSNNALLTSSNVIMVPFISWMFTKQRPSIRTIGLTFMCFAGMIVLAWSPDLGIKFNLGDWLTILCAVCYAFQLSYLGKFAIKARSAAVLSFFQIFTVGVLGAAAFLIFERDQFTVKSFVDGFWPTLFMAIFSTGLCFFLQSWAQRRAPATRAAVILSTEGLFGSVISVMMGYDKVTTSLVVGGTIILTSVILTQLDFALIAQRFNERKREIK